ncbi:MAG TPA: ATP synthase F1 subunit gamma [Polyangia bacterium]|jgi:F-type H+-transporting ATPase subunit gamma|nr:ATP synthase F1 subunit gamma [Polyangia bacterium]
MPSLKSIRTQIASKKSTQKITRAMKLVSAARLRGAQDAIVAARPYANALVEVIGQVAQRAGAEAHPLLERRAAARITLVPITSDRGLAGGFNANITRAVQRYMTERADAQTSLEIVGKKGRDYYRRRKVTVNHEVPGATGATAEELARQIASIVVDAFVNGRTDAVYLVYNEFKSAVQQRVVLEPLLPVTRATVVPPGQTTAAQGSATQETPIDFLYEPSKKELLDALLPQYIESQVHRALLESVASEFGARMTAMENATNNAKEMIADLTLKYNRVRQAAITKELMEIVSGAEALKG